MPNFRLIGYYEDTGQVYDGDFDGDDEVAAVAHCRSSIYQQECETLVLVAILNEKGANVYEPETASHITDWPTEDDNAND